MSDKRASIERAAHLVRDGMRVGLGGVLDRRRPVELCRAVAARGVRDLHVASFLAGAETEVLAAAGAVATLTTGYVDPRVGATATESGLRDGSIELREMSEHLFVAGLLAAANGLPFWPTLGASGSDVLAHLGFADVTCPYTGRPVTAVPAMPLDVALLHAPAATAQGAVVGPVHREFLDDADLAVARAARSVVVEVERIVSDDEVAGGLRTVLAPFEVHAVVLVPGGPR